MKVLALVALIVVVFLWIGLSIGRVASARYLVKVSRAHQDYYAAYRDDPGGAPPAMWDFRQGKMVPVPPDALWPPQDSSHASEGEPAHAAPMAAMYVKEGAAGPFPFRAVAIAIGQRLLDVPSLLFHGAFAGLTVLLILLSERLWVKDVL